MDHLDDIYLDQLSVVHGLGNDRVLGPIAVLDADSGRTLVGYRAQL